MHPVFKSLLITVGLGLPIVVIFIRLLFKKGLLFYIGVLWTVNVFAVVIVTKLADNFPENFPQVISLPSGMAISAIILYFIYLRVKKPLSIAIKRLEILSEGKLQENGEERIDITRSDELGIIDRSIDKINRNLINAISGISQTALSIRNASTQMSTVSEEISSGTSNEAASIEEISSSMEEMAANIVNNRNNAETTEELAKNANQRVKESSEAALNALDIMNTIASKIKVVDDIAFQTNILALNAGVEAARAGEHGKGFSVVANEVKKLAESSKLAAKEIEELSGKAALISNRANEQLNNVLPIMDETTNLVTTISNSSKEQALAADQVSAAIVEINRNIQSNATTAEEMAANAEEFENMAQTLVESIAVFEITK